MSKAKLPPLPQEYFDENRELFEAETTIFDEKPYNYHGHRFYRKSATDIGCKDCANGWIDPTGELWRAVQQPTD